MVQVGCFVEGASTMWQETLKSDVSNILTMLVQGKGTDGDCSTYQVGPIFTEEA